jgi:hypothetical protein
VSTYYDGPGSHFAGEPEDRIGDSEFLFLSATELDEWLAACEAANLDFDAWVDHGGEA